MFKTGATARKVENYSSKFVKWHKNCLQAATVMSHAEIALYEAARRQLLFFYVY